MHPPLQNIATKMKLIRHFICSVFQRTAK